MVIDPVTVFDEIQTTGQTTVSTAIAQGHAGSLYADSGHIDTYFAFRGHTFCDNSSRVRMVPGMHFTEQGVIGS